MTSQHEGQRLTSVDTAGMVPELLLAAEGAGRVLPGGALEGDPIHTAAFTFSLEPFVGDPPVARGIALLHAQLVPHCLNRSWELSMLVYPDLLPSSGDVKRILAATSRLKDPRCPSWISFRMRTVLECGKKAAHTW